MREDRFVVQCTSMKRYTVAQVRERLASALDEAEKGEPVVIERRGVRYMLSVEAPQADTARRPSIIETIDPAVAEGTWTWAWGPNGLKFQPKRRS